MHVMVRIQVGLALDLRKKDGGMKGGRKGIGRAMVRESGTGEQQLKHKRSNK